MKQLVCNSPVTYGSLVDQIIGVGTRGIALTKFIKCILAPLFTSQLATYIENIKNKDGIRNNRMGKKPIYIVYNTKYFKL